MICLSCSVDDWTYIIDGLSSVYDRVNKYSIAECLNCGLSQTSPQPNEAFLMKLYSDSYSYEIHHLVSPEKSRRARGLLKVLRGFDFSRKEVLEIGCGSGMLLREIKKRGAKITGCEIDRKSCEIANETLGANIISNIQVSEFLDKNSHKFDLIAMSHVLEHFQNPVKILKQLRSAIEENGTLLIVVPNLDGAPKTFLKRYWGYWQVPVHVTHFNRHSISRLIENCGYKVEVVATRNADFMSLGLLISNVLNLKKSEPGPLTSLLIRLFSWCWSWTYKFGRQDLIIVARPT